MTVKTYTVQDGETLSGTLFGKTQINTAATEEDSEPITVTLDGVDIACNNDYPGINCQGNTNLVLADGSVNHVTANEPRYAGIFIKKYMTLTISGSGTLTATGCGGGERGGAGIGCGFNAGKNETKARSTCGIVTIGCTLDDEGDPVGGTTGEISTSPYTYQP